ncbi:threonine synthase [Candidatus Leptofilum sp.]|uniref:threonine synthase n=1 Tax=Candidatus Leptofilum sp. TaxID=3241576 RepID=UPI003B5BE2C3
MKNVTGLRCVICQKIYQPDEVLYVCPDHGNEGILDVQYDYDAIRADLDGQLPEASGGMFAYRPFLPVAEDVPIPPLVVGGTPLQEASRLAEAAGVAELWLKDDGRNPTASLKDRASAIAIMKAQELGAEIVTTASTGNAAAALAGLAASVGQKTVIFVPKSAPAAKIAQLLVYGAMVLLVEGTYDDAFDLCLAATEKFGWYCRNTGYNPYMAEGKKTVTFELYAQLKQQRAANLPPITHLFVSVGDGCIISGVYKGLRDLVATGFLAHMPKIIGVQAEGSAYLHDAWNNNENVLTKPPIAANTVADSISAGLPRDRIKAMTAVRQSNGAFIKVTDEQILAAIPALAQGSGVFAEPASAATYAGFLKAAQTGLIRSEARVSLILTGNGLKDVNSAMKSVGKAMTVPPEITAVERILIN